MVSMTASSAFIPRLAISYAWEAFLDAANADHAASATAENVASIDLSGLVQAVDFDHYFFFPVNVPPARPPMSIVPFIVVGLSIVHL